jgi:hypothetical protein
MGKELHRNTFISTKYLFPAATADLIVHYTRQGYEIKKIYYVFIMGFFNWLYCTDCG